MASDKRPMLNIGSADSNINFSDNEQDIRLRHGITVTKSSGSNSKSKSPKKLAYKAIKEAQSNNRSAATIRLTKRLRNREQDGKEGVWFINRKGHILLESPNDKKRITIKGASRNSPKISFGDKEMVGFYPTKKAKKNNATHKRKSSSSRR